MGRQVSQQLGSSRFFQGQPQRNDPGQQKDDVPPDRIVQFVDLQAAGQNHQHTANNGGDQNGRPKGGYQHHPDDNGQGYGDLFGAKRFFLYLFGDHKPRFSLDLFQRSHVSPQQ